MRALLICISGICSHDLNSGLVSPFLFVPLKKKIMHTENSSPFEHKIVTRGYKKNFVDHDSIIYITCEDKLSTMFLENGDKIHIIKSLDAFEELLSNDGFFRIRDNTIINGKFLTEADTRITKRTVKLGKLDFRVAKNRMKDFKMWISKCQVTH